MAARAPAKKGVGSSLPTKGPNENFGSPNTPDPEREDAGMRQVQRLSAELLPLRQQVVAIGRREPDCKALQRLDGIRPVLAVAIWEELGDFAASPAPTMPCATPAWT